MKRLTYWQKVLAYLQEHKVATNKELTVVHDRFGDSVLKLRDKGYIIRLERVNHLVNNYHYEGFRPVEVLTHTCYACGHTLEKERLAA